MAFDDDDKMNKRFKSKISNKSSMFHKDKEKNQNFDELANKTFTQNEKYKDDFAELSQQYKSFILDTILKQNKGPIANNIEVDVIQKLVSLSLEMNSDDGQPEGIGSTALCTLLMKCMLLQRDHINDILYKVSLLEKDTISLKEQLKNK